MTSKTGIRLTAVLIAHGVCLSTASAHYLWVTVDRKAGGNGVANIYFEGGPSPGNGKYLDPFVNHGKTWVRTVKNRKPVPAKTAETTKPGKRWLTAKLPAAAPRSIDSYGKWGVYRYGKTNVLLHYYARHIDARNNADLEALSRAPQMALDIATRKTDGKIELTVLWKGQPVSGRPVAIRGPKRFRKNPKTNKNGVVTFRPVGKGRYTFRTSVEERDKSGTDNGKTYQLVRHNATMIINLPADKNSR